MLSKGQQVLIIGMILIIGLIPFWLVNSNSGQEIFVGSDEKAIGVVAEIAPHYQPWFKPIFSPSSTEIQSLLFALQASIGAGFIGYYLGSQRKTGKDESKC